MTVRGKPVSEIGAKLKTIGAELGPEPWAIFVIGSGGVGVPLRRLLSSWGAVRGLLNSLKDGPPALLRLPRSVDTLRIKNNARLFCREHAGASPTVTAKIGLQSLNRRGSLAREIKAHKLLASRNAASIPRLIRYGPNLTWFIEELVRRCPERDKDTKAELFLQSFARKLYAPFARSRGVSFFLRANRISAHELAQTFASAGSDLPQSALSATWPVALLHGDLSEGNMIASEDGKLYVIDWEKFRRGPVAWDMRKLFRLCPAKVYALLESLRGPRDLDPVMQMRIVSAVELILSVRGRTRKITYLTEHRGVPGERAEELIERQAALRLEAIRQGPSGGA